MCGISAIVGDAGPAAGEALLQMHSALAHRGPDGEGFLVVDASRQGHAFHHPPSPAQTGHLRPQLWLGFHRLSIQDLREVAQQPLPSRCRQHWIVMNGELYNFQELRRQLAGAGYVFHTQSDTEVALAAYDYWGTSCFEKFNGMWALLIVDLARGKLIGSRDRLGIKPLFYAVDGGRLLFASEPKAIAIVQRAGPTLQTQRFVDFLRGLPNQVAAFSFFEGIHSVPAATFFELDLAGKHHTMAPRFQPYWNLRDYVPEAEPRPFDQAKEELAALLRSSVEYQLVADVEVGSLLSGGLDSSLLTRLMALSCRPAGTPPQAFSVVFDDPSMDESRYMDAVLDIGGGEGRRVRLTAPQAWESIDRVTMAYGEPLLGHYLLAYYHVLGLVRSYGVKVVLDGQGADELFGGYHELEAVLLREKLMQGQFGDFLTELRRLAPQTRKSSLALLWSRLLGPYTHRLVARCRGRDDGVPYTWLNPETLPPGQRGAAYEAFQEPSRDPSLLNRSLYQLTRYTNLPYLLLFLDRLSMAHGIELRVPYLDHRLVEFCFRLPASYKIAFGRRKRLLCEVARPYLPSVIVERTYKMGISSNLQWLPLRPAHGEALRAMVRSTTMRHLPWLYPGPLEQFVEGYLARQHNDALTVWRLYTAWRWLELFRPTMAGAMA